MKQVEDKKAYLNELDRIKKEKEEFKRKEVSYQ